MNRLEEKLGRECTDHDFDVQQILLDRAHKRIQELEAVVWAIANAAPNRTVRFSSLDVDPYARRGVEITRHEEDMTTRIRALDEAPTPPPPSDPSRPRPLGC